MELYEYGSITPLLTAPSYIKKGKKYSDNIITFDIENSNGFIKNGIVEGYNPLNDDDYYNDTIPCSLCYEWTISINGTEMYGRELKTAIEAFEEIDENGAITCIFIHNLSHEFSFLISYLTVEKYFARQSQHPFKVQFEKLPFLEFRCTYMLTRLSLSDWANALNIEGISKQTGYDYNKIRTPLTPLTEEELHYCKMDVHIMYYGILKELKEYEHVYSIPLTQTGKVRRVVKQLLANKKGWLSHVASITPDYHFYKKLVMAYCGGDVHASYTKTGKILKDVDSYDFRSSYPFCMVACKFPLSRFVEVGFVNETEFEDYAYLMRVRMKVVRAKTSYTYISFHKCIECSKDCSLDNGRIINSDMVEMYMTEQDYLTIHDVYDIEEEEIVEAYKARKGYLPKEFIEYVLELFGNKTTLKNVLGMEALYSKSKEFVNALYGLMVMAMIFDDIVFMQDIFKFDKKKVSEKKAIEVFEKLQAKGSKSNFIPYACGVWVTAYARRHLWTVVLSIPPNKFVYRDTDSVKFLTNGTNTNFVKKWDAHAIEMLKESARVNDIPLEKFMPVDPKGRQQIIGTLDHDGSYSEFVTHGAKKYCYRDKNDGQLHLTMSGVSKKQVYLFNDNLENYTHDFVFPHDSLYSSKNRYRCINPVPLVWNEGKGDAYTSYERFGICLRNRDYVSKLTPDYEQLIALYMEKGKGCEALEIHGYKED